jgi:general secretion pathway protein G
MSIERKGPSPRYAARAFTIIEVLVIIVIIGVIAAVVAPRLISRIGAAKQSMAISNAATLATSMKTYQIDCGLPESGATLSVLVERPSNVAEGAWKGPYVDNADMLKDPWGNVFELRIPGQKNADFDIISWGADGQPGGTGDNEDVIKP